MILIALGANLSSDIGPPVKTLEAALLSLDAREEVEVVAQSSWYATAPIGRTDQPEFINGAAVLMTRLQPIDLLSALLETELAFGRKRVGRWGPRLLDLDLIDFDGLVGDRTGGNLSLTLPHPRAHERAFVLAPIAEIAPNWQHPVLKKSAKALLNGITEGQDIRQL